MATETLPKGANLLGASIFWLYIAAALAITGYILRDLAAQYARTHAAKKRPASSQTAHQVAQCREKAQVFMALAVVSFACLSYHMLYFLIESYQRWMVAEGLVLPKSLFGQNGLIDIPNLRTSLNLWRWSTASTLFEEFAFVICDDAKRFWWTLQALLFSFAWNVFMSIEGPRRQIPHLWAYFILDQILPVSFTQNLFCIALSLSPPPQPKETLVSASRTLQIGLLLAYAASLSLMPFAVRTSWYLYILFTTRALLFAPYSLLRPRKGSRGKDVDGMRSDLFARYSTLGCAMAMVLFLVQTWKAAPLFEMLRALKSSHAVSALGYDYLIGVFSMGFFVMAQS